MTLKDLVGQWFGFDAKIKELEESFRLMQDNRNYWHEHYDKVQSELTAYVLKSSNSKKGKKARLGTTIKPIGGLK